MPVQVPAAHVVLVPYLCISLPAHAYVNYDACVRHTRTCLCARICAPVRAPKRAPKNAMQGTPLSSHHATFMIRTPRPPTLRPPPAATAMHTRQLLLLAPLQLACAAVLGLTADAAMSLLLLAICPCASTSFVIAAQYNHGADVVTAVTIAGICLLVPALLAALALPTALGLYSFDLAPSALVHEAAARLRLLM